MIYHSRVNQEDLWTSAMLLRKSNKHEIWLFPRKL